MNEIVGRILFLGLNGNVDEVIEYNSGESYLNAIRKEIDCNFDGFRYETITNDPNVRKSADDCVYNAYGAENPRTLDWYIKNRGK